MGKRKKQLDQIIIIIIIVCTVFSSSIYLFSRNNAKAILFNSGEFLKMDTDSQAISIKNYLESELYFTKSIAELIGGMEDADPVRIALEIKGFEADVVIDQFHLIDTSGQCIASNEDSTDYSEASFYRAAMQGEEGIAILEERYWKQDASNAIVCYVPVYMEGKLFGVLAACNYYSNIRDLIPADAREDYMLRFLIDRDGEVLLNSPNWKGSSVVSYLKEKLGEQELEAFLAEFQSAGAADATYNGRDGDGLVHVSSVGINGWAVMQFFLSEKTAEMIEPLNHSAYVLETAMFVCLMIVAGFIMLQIYRMLNHKTQLQEVALTMLDRIYPRIVKINYTSGDCIFIKDEEKLYPALFQTYSWEEMRILFLNTVCQEDVENCRSFTALDNLRRINEQGNEAVSYVYRRFYKGELQWFQSIILPMKGTNGKDCVLMYAKNVDKTVRAEQLHKEQLLEALYQTKKAEAEKVQYIKYMIYDLKTPMDNLVRIGRTMKSLFQSDKFREAELCLSHLNSTGVYIQAMLQDILSVTIFEEKTVGSGSMIFEIACLMEDCCEYISANFPDYHRKLEVNIGENLQRKYCGDKVGLIKILFTLLYHFVKYAPESEHQIYVNVELSDKMAMENRDLVAFSLQYEGDSFGLITEKLRDNLGYSIATMVVNAIQGTMERVDDDRFRGYLVTAPLDYVPDDLERIHADQMKCPHKLIIADRQDLDFETALEILKNDGLTVMAFGNEGEGIYDFVLRVPGRADIILTDRSVSEMNRGVYGRLVALTAGSCRKKDDRHDWFEIEQINCYIRETGGKLWD